MTEGLLWFDPNCERPLSDCVRQAARRYLQKYHRPANTCYINPTNMKPGLTAVDGIMLKPANNVRPLHYWIGVEAIELKEAA